MANNGAATSATMMAAAVIPSAAATTPVPSPAAQPAPAAGEVPVWQRGHKPPALGVKFNGDPKQLVTFLVQVWTHMKEYGPKIAPEVVKV